jgi:gluconate transporter
MPLLVLAASILLLLWLTIRLKMNAFIALLIASFAAGILNGLPPDAAMKSILKGLGDTLGSLVIILMFGAMLGKQIEESGAAHTISHALTRMLGKRRVQLSVLVTGFLVGLPMMYSASFMVLIPLVYTLSTTTGLPLMYLGIPLSAALSVTHGFLPPHPAPAAVAIMFKADVNRTLLYGLVLAIPATILAGPVLALFFRKFRNQPPPDLYRPREFRPEELPGLGVSLGTTLLPVLLMLAGAVITLTMKTGGRLASAAQFLSDPNVALFLAVLVGFYTLGVRQGRNMETLMKDAAAAVGGAALIMLVIAGGGAFKQVLLDGGTGEAIKAFTARLRLSPILLAWGTAALLRGAIGSATVAAITAAGIVLPMVPSSGVAPELLVLAVGAGSVMFSHFSDGGFWMFKEYYNVSIKQTLQMWTVMETVIGLAGLLGVLLLDRLLR